MTTTLSITGMSCQNCVRHAREALEAVAGVTAVTVTLEPGQAKIEHEGVAVDTLIAAVNEEGYTATPA